MRNLLYFQMLRLNHINSKYVYIYFSILSQTPHVYIYSIVKSALLKKIIVAISCFSLLSVEALPISLLDF